MSRIKHIGGLMLLLVVGVSFASAGSVVPVVNTDDPKPGNPPTDSMSYYDNGVAGSWARIGDSAPSRSYFPHWGVAFNQGVALVDSVCAYLHSEHGHSDGVYFRIYSDSGGRPGHAIWTSLMVYLLDSTKQWYQTKCSLWVSGRFYLGESAYQGSAGHIYQAWDNDGDQAPAGTQWKSTSSGSWRVDSQAGDLMIRCHAKIRDVGIGRILAPTGTVDSGSSVTPVCMVHNYGDLTDSSYEVKLHIGPYYSESAYVYYEPPGDSQQVNFPGKNLNAPPGTYTVACSTRLAGDVNSANDWKTGSLTVQRPQIDVGTTMILAPTGSVELDSPVTPACSLKNYSSSRTLSYTVFMKIGSWTNRQSVTGHPPNTTRYLTFPTWTPSSPGAQAVSCSTELSGDVQPSNDKRTGTVNVMAGDVGVTSLLSPLGTLDSGVACTPACSVYNYGFSQVTYSVRMKIGSAYDNSVTVNSHAAGTKRYVTFPSSVVWPRGSAAVTCSTQLVDDGNPANDRRTATVNCRVLDAQVVSIITPDGTRDSGASVNPQANVRNNGSAQSTFDVVFQIGTWRSTKNVTIASGGSQDVTFDNWVAPKRGKLIVKCTTRLANDVIANNNLRRDSVFVVVHDAGVQAIIAPAGQVTPGTLTPRAMVRNFGTQRETTTVVFVINCSPHYAGSVFLPGGLPVGADTAVSFPSWTTIAGNFTSTCTTRMGNDQVAANNVGTAPFTVAPPESGWAREPDVPGGPKGKNVKDGGCIGYSVEHGQPFVYCLKGNNLLEYYKFSIHGLTWSTKETIPAIGTTGKKKAVKKGSSLTGANGKVYATKGNGTLEFWEYNPDLSGSGTYPWVSLADVPAGAKKIKEGAGSVALQVGDTLFVYFLKGSGTNEFYRFNTTTNTWTRLADAFPGISGKSYGAGSCLAGDASKRVIYALKGTTNELSVYRIASNEWGAVPPLPFAGSSARKKKVKDGAGIALYGKTLYALKGDNTTESWSYQTDSMKWTQLTDIPLGTGKKVKGGGGLICASGAFDQGPALYALKGNNTVEFYDYPVPGYLAFGPQLAADGSDAQTNSPCGAHDVLLRVSPNPFSNSTTVSYTLPEAGNVSLKLYDATGKLAGSLAGGYHESGTSSLLVPRSSLTRGVYLLKLETETVTATAKLIVQ